MKKYLITAALSLGLAVSAHAVPIDIMDFDNPTIIDFNNAPDALIANYYSGLTFVNMYSGGTEYNTGTGEGRSGVASNFESNGHGPYYDGEIYWDTPITQVGFNITTNNADDTTLTASLVSNNSVVGSHIFDTGGHGMTGTFVGIEFLSGFDSIIIDTASVTNGAFAIDNLRYGGQASQPVPEPATLLLMGTGLVGLIGLKKRQAKK